MTDEVFTDRHVNDPPWDGGDIDWGGDSYETFKANLDRYNREMSERNMHIKFDAAWARPTTSLALKFAQVERREVDGETVETPVGRLYSFVYDRVTREPVGLSLVVDDERFVIPVTPYDEAGHISAMDGVEALRKWLGP